MRLIVCVLVAVALLTGTAHAGNGRGGATETPNGDPEIFAIGDGSTPPTRGGGAASMVCTLHELSPASTVSFVAPGPQVHDPIAGAQYFVVCTDADGHAFVRLITYQPGVNVVDAATLARQAFKILPLSYPLPSTAPPSDQPQLVGVRTWMWIDPADYRSLTASVEIPGLEVTATATPQRVRWLMGDADHVVACDGPGTPYDPSVPDGAQHSDCSYVFQHSGTQTITAIIDWAVTWKATDGTGGALPTVSRGTSFPVGVEQRQAVING